VRCTTYATLAKEITLRLLDCALSIIVVILEFMEWVAKLLQDAMAYLKKICWNKLKN
jgi:hypothetical protein